MEEPRLTLGVEEEYQLCDPETGDLVPVVDLLLDAAGPALRDRLGYELLHTVLEGNIERSDSVEQAVERVRALRCAVLDLADAHGVSIAIGGVHPFARWEEQEFVDSPAYRWVGEQLEYLARRNLSFGMHVHVSVEDDDGRVWVANQLRRWCAPLLALSANAPFFEGADTGFQTIRMHVFGSFPRTGYAPVFRDWDHYERVIEGLRDSGAIEKPRHLWWSVRPHVEYGTVELRMFDMPIDLDRSRTFVGVSQALVADLIERWRGGEPGWELEPAFLEDGWFKAQRFDWDAPIAHPVTGETVALRDEIESMRETARPWARRLGTTDAAIEGIDRILESGPDTEWQRAERERAGGDLSALQRRIARRVRSEARCDEVVKSGTS
ncbi:MAG: YbdK family carboxylate-amine ligase [Gemmatimonadota bacterium]|nr:YbdK family carboxylate-amine ligase [Gemmatimonadota bacterium]